jgi:hypothetical protein
MCLGSDELLLGPLIDFHTRSRQSEYVGMLARWSWGMSQDKYGGMGRSGREHNHGESFKFSMKARLTRAPVE